MISVRKNELTVLEFDNLSRFPEICHFSSTRTGGCSSGNYSSLNLGFNSGDAPQDVTANRKTLCTALGINPGTIVFPKQTHTATIKMITSCFNELDERAQKQFLNETDAVVTDLKGVCVAIKTADCVPILLFDSKQKVVAAVHAGWRGTVQNIVKETIQLMAEKYGSSPSDLWAGIGPSISPEIYEVGEEVWSQFASEFYQATYPSKADKRLLDLWSANYHQLVNAGVPSEQIEAARICTYSNPDQFFSARRDGLKTGRMATGIMLR